MGLNYVAADVLKYNNSPFKRFSTVGLAITKSIDDLITDSAAAATAKGIAARQCNEGFVKSLQEYHADLV